MLIGLHWTFDKSVPLTNLHPRLQHLSPSFNPSEVLFQWAGQVICFSEAHKRRDPWVKGVVT